MNEALKVRGLVTTLVHTCSKCATSWKPGHVSLSHFTFHWTQGQLVCLVLALGVFVFFLGGWVCGPQSKSQSYKHKLENKYHFPGRWESKCSMPHGVQPHLAFQQKRILKWCYHHSWRLHWPGLGECFWTTPDVILLVGHFPSLYPQSSSWNTKLSLFLVPDWNFPGALLFPGSNLIDAEIWTGHAFWFWRILKLQDAFPQI